MSKHEFTINLKQVDNGWILRLRNDNNFDRNESIHPSTDDMLHTLHKHVLKIADSLLLPPPEEA